MGELEFCSVPGLKNEARGYSTAPSWRFFMSLRFTVEVVKDLPTKYKPWDAAQTENRKNKKIENVGVEGQTQKDIPAERTPRTGRGTPSTSSGSLRGRLTLGGDGVSPPPASGARGPSDRSSSRCRPCDGRGWRRRDRGRGRGRGRHYRRRRLLRRKRWWWRGEMSPSSRQRQRKQSGIDAGGLCVAKEEEEEERLEGFRAERILPAVSLSERRERSMSEEAAAPPLLPAPALLESSAVEVGSVVFSFVSVALIVPPAPLLDGRTRGALLPEMSRSGLASSSLLPLSSHRSW
ncbi:hypothetical protein KC341_g65 [Hortaea werneckii]|nr:hypothetical protein KC341_g65 [Hortaea werneckii]